MNQYEIDATDIVSEALLDTSEGGQLDAIVRLVASLLTKRDEEVRFLVKELQSAQAKAPTDLVPFSPITGTTCLARCEEKTQEQYYKASDVQALVAQLYQGGELQGSAIRAMLQEENKALKEKLTAAQQEYRELKEGKEVCNA